MKRAASDPLIRTTHPVAFPSPAPAGLPSLDNATQPSTDRTTEELRGLPVPPFPPDVDFSGCDVAMLWARQGMPSAPAKEDIRNFALFCLRHRYRHVLSWMVLRGGIATLPMMHGAIDDKAFLWLIAWVDTLPCLINLSLSNNEIDLSALDVAAAVAHSTRLGGLDVHENLAPVCSAFFDQIRNNTVLTTLSVDLPAKEVDALNRYLQENTSLRTLGLHKPVNGQENEPTRLDHGLVFNHGLNRIELCGWELADELVDFFFKPHSTLTSVCFSACAFHRDTKWYSLSNTLSSNHNLLALKFKHCNTSSSTQSALVKALRFNNALTSLTFDGSLLDTDVLLAMQKALQNNTTLLRFQYQIETDDGSIHPEDALRRQMAMNIESRLQENRNIRKVWQHSQLAQPTACFSATVHAIEQGGEILPVMQNAIGSPVLPPFPKTINFCCNKLAAEWARNGMPEELKEDDLIFFTDFCIRHRCADVLTWMMTRHATKTLKLAYVIGPFVGIHTSDFLWTLAWVEKLPYPISLDAYLAEVDWYDHDVADAVASSKNIISLGMTSRLMGREESPYYFFDKLKENTVITRLHFYPAYSADFPALGKYLQENRALTSLHIDCASWAKNPQASEMTGDDWEIRRFNNARSALTNGLLANEKLTSISIVWFLIDQKMVAALLDPKRELTTLEINWCKIDPEAVTTFGHAIGSHRTLTTLTLLRCEFNRYGRGSWYPRYVYDQWVSVTAHPPLVEALRSNQSITTLSIMQLWSYEVMIALRHILEVNTTLLHIIEKEHGFLDFPTGWEDNAAAAEAEKEVRRRLAENREIARFASDYPLAEYAFCLLPGGHRNLPPEVSKHIVGMLMGMGPAGVATYPILHRLSAYTHIQAQRTPSFPKEQDLTPEPLAKQLAQIGRKVLPLPPTELGRLIQFCIEQRAGDALAWLVVHSALDTLDLSQGTDADLRWLIKWTRSAPCQLKLSLHSIKLNEEMVAFLSEELRFNLILTALSLQHCVIEPLYLPPLVEWLSFNNTLEKLALPEQCWSDRILADMAQVLQTNRTLIEINCDFNDALSARPFDSQPGTKLLGRIAELLQRNRLLKMWAQEQRNKAEPAVSDAIRHSVNDGSWPGGDFSDLNFSLFG